MKKFFWRVGRLWVQGLVLLLLRLWQNRSGFDADTGLSVPSLPGTALAAGLVVLAVIELIQALRMPGEKLPYARQFAPPDKRSLAVAVIGCLLLAGGGALTLLAALLERGILAAATGALAIAAGAGLLVLLFQSKAGAAPSALAALPAMFFGVFFVLTVYLPSESDPVLARIYLPVLAVAVTSYTFAQLGGLLRGESAPRSFVSAADLAVPLCLAAAAGEGLAPRLLYAGCALILSVFLALRRDAAVPSGGAPDAAEERE